MLEHNKLQHKYQKHHKDDYNEPHDIKTSTKSCTYIYKHAYILCSSDLNSSQ